ncbi:major facilitator superfamily domain-containing protein [Aspergillus alliaceus]|uniref:major facilitator superfamily domain-containing protein n=1 Tax=Petromyces alliaceus TaxID=209559 RepID=UPI0012A558B7|nr:major facilitator superfamily domain-containing protein [Aspergillus alliaceus]KAB8237556.1 major facilitator superfamily domain-containing protein [Aspergillus alliaceus]
MGNDTDVAQVGSFTTEVRDMQGEKEAPFSDDPEWNTAQNRYLRKLDYIILPTISALYFFEYLDRGNIANAKLYGYSNGYATYHHGIGPGDGMLSSTQWQLVVMIFYVGLVLFQVPGCIGYRIFSPSKWVAFGVCGWAMISMLQCTAYNLAGALVCRVFIGFLKPTAVAGAFGGLIAFGIGHIDGSVPNWKWLFLIEALPCFCLGLFCLYWLPDRPMGNSRFCGQDQQIAEARYKNEPFDKAGKIQTPVYLPTAALLSSISGFLPTIISNLGYSKPATANLMTVPPYAAAFILMLVTSYSSDHFRERGTHITGLMIVATIAYALLATLPEHQLKGKYACVCIAVACVYATYPPSHAWAANNFGNETKRAIGMGYYMALGNLGRPQFKKGHFICMGLAIATGIIALGNSLLLRAINNYRDRKFGKPEAGVAVDVTDLADNSPMFRFIT